MNSNKDNRATTQQSCWLVPELKQQQQQQKNKKKKAQNPKNKTKKQQTAKQKKPNLKRKNMFIHQTDTKW